MVWKRPDSVPFPNVWGRFKGRKPMADGKIPSFRIQDIPDELRERAIDFMCANFLQEEPIAQHTSCKDNKEAEMDFRKLWHQGLKPKLALICLMEDDDGNVPENPVIAGVNMTTLASVDDKFELEDCAFWSFMAPVIFITKGGNPFKRFGVTEYMAAYGLSVKKSFSGQNIGYELLKARMPLCKAVGLKFTGTVFTATVSQILAERCGYVTYYEETYKDLVEKHKMEMTKKTDSIKFMVLHVS